MSRIGKKPIEVPADIKVSVDGAVYVPDLEVEFVRICVEQRPGLAVAHADELVYL